MQQKKVPVLLFLLISLVIASLLVPGCINIYPDGSQEEPGDPESTQPEEIPEAEVKQKIYNAAQREIEDNPLYDQVDFDSGYDPNRINRLARREYKYECEIEFLALDTNIGSKGRFVWTFIITYDPDQDRCTVESGSKQSGIYMLN